MGYSEHELGTINVFYCHITPLPITPTSPQQPPSSVPKVAVVERFDF